MVTIARVAAAIERHGDAFARKVLGPAEMDDYTGATAPERLLAKRFAAKEAFAKALGTGIGAAAGWHDIRVIHDAVGRPGFEIGGAAGESTVRLGVNRHHLSLSDEHHQVVAVAVLEGPG